ncbi:MAG: DNA-directed RNA polymerase subunit omega [Oscillospiraceae bacterium]|nr:DNA-directed RNA polymerase subunit omega [Oscillospiraceae bacterium]
MPMTSPSIIDLLGHADCRYTLVVDVSKRARQLVGGSPALINTKEKKPLVVAIEEVNGGLITYDRPQEEE